MKQKLLTTLLCLLLVASLSACGVNEEKAIEEVSGQCEHILSLAFDVNNNGKTKVSYDTKKDTWTAYIINTNTSAEDMKNFAWQGNGTTILNLENSLNNLCQSLKGVFDKSDLKKEDYTVIIHFTDENEKVYFTSKNGITDYSAWGK